MVNWCYLPQGSVDFLSDKTFWAIWFAYIRLVELEGNMTYRKCGPKPDVTIFDGVTLVFNRKNLLSTMKPPTVILPSSQVKQDMQPSSNQQCIKDKSIWKKIQSILSGPKLALPEFSNLSIEDENSEPQDDTSWKCEAEQKKAESLAQCFDMIPEVVKYLSTLDVQLGMLFDYYFGHHAVISQQQVPPVYHKLFLQVCIIVIIISQNTIT